MAQGLLLAEKRQLERKELIYYLRVSDLLNDQELGRMIDIHINGLFLMSHNPLIIGHDYLVSIEMPKALKNQGMNNIALKARPIWIKPSSTQPYHEIGLMFINPKKDSITSIEMLIELFAMPNGAFNTEHA
jgi:Tfp pilus assembly protein PilZ